MDSEVLLLLVGLCRDFILDHHLEPWRRFLRLVRERLDDLVDLE